MRLYAGRKPALGFREKMDPQKPPVARDRKMTAAVAVVESAAARPSPAFEAPAASGVRGGAFQPQLPRTVGDPVPRGAERQHVSLAGRADWQGDFGPGARRPGALPGTGLFRRAVHPFGGPGRLPGRPLQQTVASSSAARRRRSCRWFSGVASILQGNIYLMFAVLALMGAQAGLFSPAKMSSIPEIVCATGFPRPTA